MVTGALGVIWGLDALYEAIVHPMSDGFRAKSRLYGQMTDFARHLLLVRPDDDCVSCSRRILGVVTGALGVIWV